MSRAARKSTKRPAESASIRSTSSISFLAKSRLSLSSFAFLNSWLYKSRTIVDACSSCSSDGGSRRMSAELFEPPAPLGLALASGMVPDGSRFAGGVASVAESTDRTGLPIGTLVPTRLESPLSTGNAAMLSDLAGGSFPAMLKSPATRFSGADLGHMETEPSAQPMRKPSLCISRSPAMGLPAAGR